MFYTTHDVIRIYHLVIFQKGGSNIMWHLFQAGYWSALDSLKCFLQNKITSDNQSISIKEKTNEEEKRYSTN